MHVTWLVPAVGVVVPTSHDAKPRLAWLEDVSCVFPEGRWYPDEGCMPTEKRAGVVAIPKVRDGPMRKAGSRKSWRP